MPSDDGELWNAVRKERQKRRASNREEGLNRLLEIGVTPTIKNDGAHLIIGEGKDAIDYWPGTGLWVRRDRPDRKHRGIDGLLRSIRLYGYGGEPKRHVNAHGRTERPDYHGGEHA